MRVLVNDMVAYLLVRTDIDSMNPGKALAQAFHAGNQALKDINRDIRVHDYIMGGIIGGADFFNTCICLGATKEQLVSTVERAALQRYPSGIVKDPSYPFWVEREVAGFFSGLMPGKIVGVAGVPGRGTTLLMTREEITCGWIIGQRNDEDLKDIVRDLELHP